MYALPFLFYSLSVLSVFICICKSSHRSFLIYFPVAEIKNYEKEVSNDNVKLDIFKAEASEFEKLELEVKAELEDLEKTEWVHVMDNEQKWEVDIKLQVRFLLVLPFNQLNLCLCMYVCGFFWEGGGEELMKMM